MKRLLILTLLICAILCGHAALAHAQTGEYVITDAPYSASTGSADNTTAIQDAENAAHSAGGGIVIVPPGTFLTCSLTLYGDVVLRGDGPDVSTLRELVGCNTDALISTANFATLTGTNSTGGESEFAVRDLTIDGNASGQGGGAGDCFRIYGFEYELANLHIHDCGGAGIYSEWSTAGTAPNNGAMEAFVSDLKLHDNHNGLYWNGPHDSFLTGIDSFHNAAEQLYLNSVAQLSNVHLWEGVTSGDPNLVIAPGASRSDLVNIVSEGALSAPEIEILAGEVHLFEAYTFAGGSGAGTAVGVQIGDGTHRVGGLYVSVQGSDWYTGGATVAFTNDGGNSLVDAVTYTPNGGADHTGTPASSTVYRHP